MNVMQTTPRHSSILLLLTLCVWLSGPILCGEARDVDSPISLDINWLKSQADVILVGNLESVPPPYEVLGRIFYKIEPRGVLKGSLPTESRLLVRTDVDSYEGSTPSVERSVSYMLFLKQIKLEDKAAPTNLTYYCLVGNWKGIVSLDKNASERRAVDNIAKRYGVNIQEMAEEFKEAMQYSLKQQDEDTGRAKENLTPGALVVYKSMKLERTARR